MRDPTRSAPASEEIMIDNADVESFNAGSAKSA
jgi:hypothetical protein